MLFVIFPKPKYGEACNRCGECCRQELCEVGQLTFLGESAPCPALEWDGTQFGCGMVLHPERYLVPHWSEKDQKDAKDYLTPHIAECVGIGQGCGMPDEAEAAK